MFEHTQHQQEIIRLLQSISDKLDNALATPKSKPVPVVPTEETRAWVETKWLDAIQSIADGMLAFIKHIERYTIEEINYVGADSWAGYVLYHTGLHVQMYNPLVVQMAEMVVKEIRSKQYMQKPTLEANSEEVESVAASTRHYFKELLNALDQIGTYSIYAGMPVWGNIEDMSRLAGDTTAQCLTFRVIGRIAFDWFYADAGLPEDAYDEVFHPGWD